MQTKTDNLILSLKRDNFILHRYVRDTRIELEYEKRRANEYLCLCLFMSAIAFVLSLVSISLLLAR